MELKDRIAAVRKAAGLTQEQMGELVGVTRQAVSKWESGQTVPDAITIGRLCLALHVSANYVLLGREPEETDAEPAAWTRPDRCPCCGRSIDGAICPHCGYPLPDAPPSHQRYAVTAVGQYYANPYAEEHLMRFCGLSREEARRTLQDSHGRETVLRRGLTDGAARYLAANLNRAMFSAVRVVADDGGPAESLPGGGTAMAVPEPEPRGLDFWGVVGAVTAALALIFLLQLVLAALL